MFGRKTKIKYRIMRLGIISVIVATVSLTLCSTVITQTIQTDKFSQQLESLSKAYAENVSLMTNTIKLQIESTAANPRVQDKSLSNEEMKKVLNELAVATYFKDLSIADRDGHTLNDTDISEREYFQRALEGETYISSPVIRLTDNTVTTMVGTLMPDGRVLYGALSSKLFSNGLETAVSESGIELVYVLDKDGMVIASSDGSLVQERANFIQSKDKHYADVSEKMIEGKTGIDRVKGDRANYGVSYMPIDDSSDWSIAVVGDYIDALSSVMISIVISFSLGLFLILLEVVVAYKISGRITKSVEYSMQRLDLLSYGDIHTEAEIRYTNDESEKMTESLSMAVRELSRYINSISENLSNMAQGDFSNVSEVEFKGDFEKISDSFNEINRTLGKLINEINTSSADVLVGAHQISEDSAALADGTTKQSTAVEELTTTMARIAEQAESTAKNAKYAAKISASAADRVTVQEHQMSELLDTMTEVKEKSSEISSIIKTIEDISFQTNILALNASIEAARAGDAGSGFAVVADEVVDLANKSAQAAQDSAALISQTLTAVNRGFKAVKDSTEKMSEVKKMSVQVNDIISDISHNSDDQATAISQTSAGIEQISEVVAQNSVTAIHTATSCEQLTVQVNSLREKISKLKV